jgi:diadenosine tetraphosphatase ApaH/serine/threonine PP2A family protein phosphatase
VRYLILSDLHANLEALQAVLGHASGLYDKALCCGDLIGYGGDPNAVVEWVRANCQAVVRGNHDKASTGQEDLEWFNPVARIAALWTQAALTSENYQYVRDLPQGPIAVDGFHLIHGAPFDEDEYVMGCGDAGHAFEYLGSSVGFFGHTHLQGGFIWNGGRVETIGRMPSRVESQRLEIDRQCAYLVNPGSVGQPRDGDPRAAYLVYDSAAAIVQFRRVAYDMAAAQMRIREVGLPGVLADRLAVGR